MPVPYWVTAVSDGHLNNSCKITCTLFTNIPLTPPQQTTNTYTSQKHQTSSPPLYGSYLTYFSMTNGRKGSFLSTSQNLVRGGFQPRLPTSLPPPGQQQQPSPLPRRQPVPLMPPAQLHPGAPQVVAPAPAGPLQSPPPSELMDVDHSAGPPSQTVAVQPVLQPLSLGTPKESDTAAPCPAPTQQPSTQRQETLPLFVGPDAPSRPVPEAAPVVTVKSTDCVLVINNTETESAPAQAAACEGQLTETSNESLDEHQTEQNENPIP
ncbi:vegetative cell wall protein gp1-like [Schistocerca americana]|uniref:vegetative cell wall protein gp1-like n=1 Tax=Schistocerca americana TaxID=7009 RepID=UPI001F4F3953|nr:vegetative cell wall protein gp1-like [Schistocerca americana]